MNGPAVKDVYAKVLELQNLLTATPLADGVPAAEDEFDYHRGKVMAHASWLLAILPEVFAEAVAKRIEFPKLARSLMLAGVKHDTAIDFAIQWYLEAMSDAAAVEELTSNLSDECQRQLSTRLRRQLRHHRANLDQLGIDTLDVSVGDPFDESVHDVIGTEETHDCLLADTIARIEGLPTACKWQDDQGNLQTRPVTVALYVLVDRPDGPARKPRVPGRSSNGHAKQEVQA